MRITLHVRDEGGWPIMTADPPQLEGGDRGIRLINYARDRADEVAELCRRQRELTKKAKAEGAVRHPATFLELWRQALTGEP